MLTVINIQFKYPDNAGCNNGNYGDFTLMLDNNMIIKGDCCACLNGCSNTERPPSVGMTFKDEKDLFNYMNVN